MSDCASFLWRIASLESQERNQNLGEKIAASGFYEHDNGLVCFSCNLMMKYEDVIADPDEIHKVLRPDCSFVKKDLAERIQTELDKPEHSEFTKYESRLQTFENWPITVVSPSQLSKAGFFYEDNADKVTCYHCGVSLKHWEEGDVPILEHIRLESDCPFLNHIKGKEFVSQFLEFINQDTPNEQQDANDDIDSEENNIEDTERCIVCWMNSRNTVLSPCGHNVCCYCSFEMTNCPECRADIFDRIRPLVSKNVKVIFD